MKKKLLISLSVALLNAVAINAVAIAVNQDPSQKTFASEKPATLSCNYYFNPSNGYTSIHDINESLYDGESVANSTKTWGTITCNFYNGTTYQYYIQSTDQYGNSCALGIYKASTSSLAVGTVVTINGGTYSLYNGLPQVTSPTIEVDYESNAYPVETLETDSSYWSVTSSGLTEVGKKGPIQVSISNVSISAVQSNQATATFSNDRSLTLFYNSISEKTAIYNVLSNLAGKKANIVGYSTRYSKSNTGSPMLELLIRHASDIEERVVNLESISVSSEKTDYFVGDSFVKPTVTANYDDGSHADVTDDATFSGYDMSASGNQTVTVSYGGKSTSYQINVEPVTLSSIAVSEQINEFNVGDSFSFGGVVTATYNNSDVEDVTSLATFSGYDMSQVGYQTVTVSYGGKSTTYQINVKAVTLSSISVSGQTTSFDVGDSFSFGGVVTANYSNDSHADVTSEATFSGYDMSQTGNQTVTVSYGGKSTTYQINVKAIVYEHEIIDTSSISISTKYTTGNYGQDGNYGYYRAYGRKNYASYFAKLLPYTGYAYSTALPGSIYNVSPIDDIASITIEYYTEGSSGEKPFLTFGEQNYTDGKISFNYSDSSTEVVIDLSSYDVNYFRISSGDVTLYLESVDIAYSDTATTHGDTFVYDSSTSYRVTPSTYSGSLVAGSTSVTVPVEVSIDEGNETYSVISNKTYTYYTYEYVYDHPECMDDAAMITPVDVSNYYTIFGVFPANYASSIASISSVFGSYSRQVSTYSRTDGYATAVPYRNEPGEDTPLYYEFDIALDSSYASNNRGVGRVVAWKYGFTCYGSEIVCVYTDDHYSTFQEFNNLGGFNPRFNSERTIAGREFIASTNLSLA